jgi:hypothetical protein
MRVKTMDKKTNVKVMNGMAEKIEINSNDINQIWDFLKDLKDDITIIFKNIKKDRTEDKIETLDDKIKRLDTSAYNNLVNLEIDINARLEKLEKINLLNAERNTKYIEHFEKMADIMEMCEIADKRIDKVVEMADNINERCNVLTNFDEKILNCLEIIDERIHHLKSDIKELAKNDIELDDKIIEHYDDLEAKNFVIKRDVDTVIYDHEMFLKQLEDKFINNNEEQNNE